MRAEIVMPLVRTMSGFVRSERWSILLIGLCWKTN